MRSMIAVIALFFLSVPVPASATDFYVSAARGKGKKATKQKPARDMGNIIQKLNPGDTVPNLETKVVGPDRFFEALPACPARGVYTLGGNQIPALGDLYLDCSLSTSHSHIPERIADW